RRGSPSGLCRREGEWNRPDDRRSPLFHPPDEVFECQSSERSIAGGLADEESVDRLSQPRSIRQRDQTRRSQARQYDLMQILHRLARLPLEPFDRAAKLGEVLLFRRRVESREADDRLEEDRAEREEVRPRGRRARAALTRGEIAEIGGTEQPHSTDATCPEAEAADPYDLPLGDEDVLGCEESVTTFFCFRHRASDPIEGRQRRAADAKRRLRGVMKAGPTQELEGGREVEALGGIGQDIESPPGAEAPARRKDTGVAGRGGFHEPREQPSENRRCPFEGRV